MDYGINLPHLGRKGTAEAVQKASEQAEALGFADVWVNDHLAIPAEAPYPPTARFLEPLITLTWAAAVTKKVGLGTSVLVLPLRNPVHLAKELATLDVLSGGRVILGAGVGWLEGEYAALGVPFDRRGPLTNECLEIIQACWYSDPVTMQGRETAVSLMETRTLPQPEAPIPIWIGGLSPAALRRAAKYGNGWHGLRQSPEELVGTLKILQEQRAAFGRDSEDFTISMRLHWDGLMDDPDELRQLHDQYAACGVQHMSFEPRQRELDGWLSSVEKLARLFIT